MPRSKHLASYPSFWLRLCESMAQTSADFKFVHGSCRLAVNARNEFNSFLSALHREAHAEGTLQLPRRAEKRAQPQKLNENEVVDQGGRHDDED